MAKSLVIVESPTKAKTISKFLGRGYTVKASMGHLRDLPRSQFGVDIENNYQPKYITVRGKGPILQELKKLAKKSDRVLLATDPDREGEAIAWHLAQALEIDEENCRIEFREVTKQAIKNAVKEPRSIEENLVSAQQGRRVLDRIVGYKLSPLLWAKVKKGLSAGRVQSVAIKLICDREAEIEAFIPQEYWSATGVLLNSSKSKFEAKLFRFKNKKIDLNSQKDAEIVKKNTANLPWTVSKVSKKERKRNPSPPFTTSSLQQEASRKLNFTARKTMMIAQQLYEGIELGKEGAVGLITYIRTDATRIAQEAITEVREYINTEYSKDYLPKTPPNYQSKAGAQEAHEAIRPTSVLRSPSQVKAFLSRDQNRLYKLIWERLVASQMAPAIMNSVTADINVGDYTFRATGSSIKFPGFIKIYIEGTDEIEEKQDMLPDLIENEVLTLKELQLKQHFTKPPARYSEAMLGKVLEDEGIGRPSTYAPIIDTILKRGYVVFEEKRFVPTELGQIVVEVLQENFGELLDVDFTANLEKRLDEVEDGKVDWIKVIDDFYQPFAKDLELAYEQLEKIEIEEEVSDTPCDKCGAMMVVKWGRFGKFLACPNYPDCRNTKPLLTEIGVKCPDCKDGAIVERRTKKGRVFYGCSNYPECEFSNWNRPVDQKCPHCDQLLVQKKGKEDPICANKDCSGGSE